MVGGGCFGAGAARLLCAIVGTLDVALFVQCSAGPATDPRGRRSPPASQTAADGVDAAWRLYRRSGVATARRYADHGRVAIPRAQPAHDERVNIAPPERILRRLRTDAASRRGAGGPLRCTSPRTAGAKSVRRRRNSGRAHLERWHIARLARLAG